MQGARIVAPGTQRLGQVVNLTARAAEDERGCRILDIEDAAECGELVGPDILSCGSPITTTRGHCHWLGLIADTKPEVERAAQRMLAEGGTTMPGPILPENMPVAVTDANSPAVRGYAEDVTPEQVELAPAPANASLVDAAEELRGQMRELVFEKAGTRGLPVILVTHDPSDAAAAGGEILRID